MSESSSTVCAVNEGGSAEIARRHHTVPRFFLRGFADGERITTVRLPGSRRFTQSVRHASVVTDFYSVEGHPDGEDVVEKALGEIEGAAAEAIRQAASGSWPLGQEDRTWLGFYLAVQMVRTPIQRRTVEYLARQMRRMEIALNGKPALREALESHTASKLTDVELNAVWKRATSPDGPPFPWAKAAHIEQMFEDAISLLPYIVGRPWCLVTFDRRSLITSDSPVCLVRDPEAPSSMGVGFLNAKGITIALTRKVALVMGDPEPFMDNNVPVQKIRSGACDSQQVGTTAIARSLNEGTIRNSTEWLFHHPDDATLIPERLPEPRDVAIRMSSTGRTLDEEPPDWMEAVDALGTTIR
ncbi:DUF4238 domain-containing protein [Cellulomonas sp. 179-A 4D5 NHS]|uniref:DUF4238 domain-containing protein n=1 Tax=Cellulomonas sp. 179-A 4D5 NHS TaxID=3142378 RepID=UPI0039A11063